MDFKIYKKNRTNYYHKNELDIVRSFAKEVEKELGEIVKTIAIFGSHAKKLQDGSETHKKSDIDILIVIDDSTRIMSQELLQTIKIILEKKILQISKKIHLTTLMLTQFWDLSRKGDPIIINILRDGVPIIDSGFFDPMQALLFQGKIRPSWESVWTYYQRAPATLQNSRWHLLQATVDLYWAVVDSAHAALMKVGEMPPSPSHVADLMDKKMVPQKHAEQKHVATMRNFHEISKKIVRKEIRDISGADFERLYKDAKDFVDHMRKIIEN